MTSQIDVSVVIPTYNRLWCLPKAVDSCRGTRCRTEIVVVDDGSTDGTWQWLREQPDILALKQPNLGQAWAANRGTAASRGAYIRYLDSDDFLCPGMIDRQFETAVSTGADLVYSRVDDFFHPSGRIRECADPPLWDDYMAIQLGEGYGSHYLGMLFRRSLVEQVPRRQDYSIRDDRMLLLEIGLLNPKLAVVPGCAGYWVRHGDQIHTMPQGPAWAAANWQGCEMFRRILTQLEDRNELTPRRARAAAHSLWNLAHSLAHTHLREAADVAAWIVRLDPQFVPPEPGLVGQMYRRLGFRRTEQVLRLRRTLLAPWRGWLAKRQPDESLNSWTVSGTR